MEASTPALVAQSLNHWTTRQVPTLLLLNSSLQGLTCPSPVVLFPAPPWLSWFWGFCWLNYLIYVLILLFLVQILIRYLTKYALCVCVFSRSVKSDLCLTLCNSTDCSLPCSSVHGIFPNKNTGVGCHFLFQAIFPTQGSNPCLPHLLNWQADS